MTTTQPEVPRSLIGGIASAVVAPTFVMIVISTVAAIGAISGHRWAVALLCSLAILVCAVTAVILVGARPLPRVADRSHLLTRLSWLGRYGTAAFLLCVSTFVGGLAGTAIPSGGSAQEVVDSLAALIGMLGLYAFRIAVVIFVLWLTVDVWRLGGSGRRAGGVRAMRALAGSRVASWFEHPTVGRWIEVLSAPLAVLIVAIAAIVATFLEWGGA